MNKIFIALTVLFSCIIFNAWDSGGRSPFINYHLKGQGLDDDRFIEWLSTQPSYNGLIQLDLDNNHLTEKAVKALGNSNIGVPNSISLANNPIGDEGAKALALASMFSGTMILSLPNTQITAQGVKYLLGSESLLLKGFLTYLDLSNNDLGDAGVEIITQSSAAKSLTVLYLENVGITDFGAIALAKSENFGNISHLYAPGNKLTAKGVSAIRNSKNFADKAVFYFGEAFE